MNYEISNLTYLELDQKGVLVGRNFVAGQTSYKIDWAIYRYESNLYIVEFRQDILVKRITY